MYTPIFGAVGGAIEQAKKGSPAMQPYVVAGSDEEMASEAIRAFVLAKSQIAATPRMDSANGGGGSNTPFDQAHQQALTQYQENALDQSGKPVVWGPWHVRNRWWLISAGGLATFGIIGWLVSRKRK